MFITVFWRYFNHVLDQLEEVFHQLGNGYDLNLITNVRKFLVLTSHLLSQVEDLQMFITVFRRYFNPVLDQLEEVFESLQGKLWINLP